MAESTPSSLSKDPLADTPVAQMQDLLDRQKQAYLAEGLVSAATRNDRLERAANLLINNGDKLVEAMCADFGHRSEQQSLFTDVAASIGPCLLYTSPSPRDQRGSRMPSSA